MVFILGFPMYKGEEGGRYFSEFSSKGLSTSREYCWCICFFPVQGLPETQRSWYSSTNSAAAFIMTWNRT